MTEETKNVIILIHGAWHTGNCFQYVKPLLEREPSVVEVIIPHLAGHTPAKNRVIDALEPSKFAPLAQEYAQISMKTYIDELTNLVKEKQSVGDIHLVAHSMGGVTTQHFLSTLDSELLQSVKSVTFLAAYLTCPNTHLNGYIMQTIASPLLPHIVMPFERPPFISMNPSGAQQAFYNLVQDESILKQAVEDLVLEPVIPHFTPVQNVLKDLDHIKQVYIETLQDNAVLLEQQRFIVNEQREQCGNDKLKVVTMDCDHSPFYSCPETLAQQLLNIIVEKN
jgi:pimeloyl-ACP methyl ester carboxylesterase